MYQAIVFLPLLGAILAGVIALVGARARFPGKGPVAGIEDTTADHGPHHGEPGAHGGAGDRLDRRHGLLPRIDIGVIDPLAALQRTVRPKDRRQHRREAADQLAVIAEVRAPAMAAKNERRREEAAAIEVSVDYVTFVGVIQSALDRPKPPNVPSLFSAVSAGSTPPASSNSLNFSPVEA